MANLNLIHRLLDGRSPDSVAFIGSSGKKILTSDLIEAAEIYARILRSLGVRKNDVVSVKLEKRIEVFFLAYGCFYLGAVLQPINTQYTGKETRQIVEDAGSTLLVCEDKAAIDDLSMVLGDTGVQFVEITDFLSRASLPMPGSSSVPMVKISGDEVAVLLYTSGTTGRPKGARITHSNLLQSAAELARVWRIDSNDVLLHALPIYHAHGLLTSVNTMLIGGGSVSCLSKFDLDNVVEALPHTSVIMGVPTHYARLVESNNLNHASANLRLAISGSAPLSGSVSQRFEQATGLKIRERYGTTETAIVAAVPIDAEDRDGWVGWPLPGVELRLRTEDGQNLARDAVGEIETRGHNVFAGYLNNSRADEESFTEDGWFRTGDIGKVDSDGCLRLLARVNDVIISGGLNVYPAEVEEALTAVPGVSAAAVFGLPHPDFGEAVIAALELDSKYALLDELNVQDRVRRTLAAFKAPKKLVVCDLPRDAMGKVSKEQLKAQFAHLFDSSI